MLVTARCLRPVRRIRTRRRKQACLALSSPQRDLGRVPRRLVPEQRRRTPEHHDAPSLRVKGKAVQGGG